MQQPESPYYTASSYHVATQPRRICRYLPHDEKIIGLSHSQIMEPQTASSEDTIPETSSNTASNIAKENFERHLAAVASAAAAAAAAAAAQAAGSTNSGRDK